MFARTYFVAPIVGALLLVSSICQATSITFSDSAVSANINDIFVVDLLMDFSSDATFGGGMDIFFDSSVISFQSFDFSTSTLSLDPGFSRSPDALLGGLEGLAFGNFAGISGPGIIGTLVFQAIGVGDILLTSSVTTDALKGGDFISFNTFGAQSVTFGSANVSVQPSFASNPISTPPVSWLFAGGLAVFIGLSRAKRRSSV